MSSFPSLLLILSVLAVLVVAVVSWLVTRLVLKARLGARATIAEAQLADVRQTLSDERASHAEALAAERTAHAEALAAEREKRENDLRQLREAQHEALREQAEALRTEFAATSAKLLKEQSDSLENDSRKDIDDILRPLRETMAEMNKAMNATTKAQTDEHATLREQLRQAIDDMRRTTDAVGTRAEQLAVALTGKPKMQGCFGENLLETILAMEGFHRGQHYDREVANRDDSRPDYVFHFVDDGEQRDLVVDSKVSLTAYAEYMNATDDATRAAALKAHLASIHKHIDELSAKEYHAKTGAYKSFADYVLMFMPNDMAFRVALDAEPDLFSRAYARRVLITTEQTIIPFLKILHLTWNRYDEDRRVAAIMESAGNMIDRVQDFCDSYNRLGAQLRTAFGTYNAAANKLADHGPSIVTSARQVVSAGAKLKKAKDFTPIAPLEDAAQEAAETGSEETVTE